MLAERAARAPGASPRGTRPRTSWSRSSRRHRRNRSRSLRDPRFTLERETLKLVLQHPIVDRPDDGRARRGGLHAPDLPRVSGSSSRPPAARRPVPTTTTWWPVCATRDRPGGRGRGQRAERRAAAERRSRASPTSLSTSSAARAHGLRRIEQSQVEDAAHQPGRARRRRSTGCSVSWPRSRSTAASCATGSSGRSEAPDELRRTAPAVSRWRRGRRCWPGPRPRRARSPAPARRSTCPSGERIPWEQVEAADWDLDSATLRISEVGTWGEPRPAYSFVLTEPGRLLQLVRERVTATVVLQRHVPIRGSRGVRVIARRARHR